MKEKRTYKKWLNQATLAWIRFASLEEIKKARNIPECLSAISSALKTEEGRKIAWKLLYDAQYFPFPSKEYHKKVRRCILRLLKTMPVKELRAMLKDENFKRDVDSIMPTDRSAVTDEIYRLRCEDWVKKHGSNIQKYDAETI